MPQQTLSKQDVIDVVQFLKDSRQELRRAACQGALVASADEDGCKTLQEAGGIPLLCRLTGDHQLIAKDAVTALVNAAATSPAIIEEMVQKDVTDRVMENVGSSVSDSNVEAEASDSMTATCLKLLANVTTVDAGVEQMLQMGKAGGALEGLHVRKLIRWFTQHPCAGASTEDVWEHVASILVNISRHEAGQKLLMRPQLQLLQQLLPELHSANVVRRIGVSGCLRNCCFEEKQHLYMISEVGAIPPILRQLADIEDSYDFEEKVLLDPSIWQNRGRRENDPRVCKHLVETLLCLCSYRKSREVMRKRGVYEVVREFDKSTKDEELGMICYEIVNYLQRDEEGQKERIDYLRRAMAREKGEDAGEAGDQPQPPMQEAEGEGEERQQEEEYDSDTEADTVD